MKFLSLADWTGIVETELFAQTYKSYGLATVRYPVLEIEARVEPFDNGRGFSLRVYRGWEATESIASDQMLRCCFDLLPHVRVISRQLENKQNAVRCKKVAAKKRQVLDAPVRDPIDGSGRSN